MGVGMMEYWIFGVLESRTSVSLVKQAGRLLYIK